jgi:hypothetical protein
VAEQEAEEQEAVLGIIVLPELQIPVAVAADLEEAQVLGRPAGPAL